MSLQKPYHIKGKDFERAYKDYLSDFRTWKHLGHASKYLIFPRNLGPNVTIDETALSDGELYTIISNKDAHGGKGALIAIVKGTKVEDVVEALNRIFWYERSKVLEITMDFSASMHSIATQCFPYAMITLDRFHVQKDCYDAMQQLRISHLKEAKKAEIEAREQHRLRNKRNKAHRKQGKKDPRGRKPNRANERYEPPRLSNGDTLPELLARSRYLLMVSAEKWTQSQKTRAKILFELYPDIQTAYSLLLVSDKKLSRANRKGDKPFGKSPKICNFAFATIKIQIYGQRYKFLRTAGTKSANKIDGQAKN